MLALGAQAGRTGRARGAGGWARSARAGSDRHGMGAWSAGGRAGVRSRLRQARGAGGGRRMGRAAGEAQARGARQAGAGRAGCARPGRWARGLATGCALGALGLFSVRFDSVFFLSQFLDVVRELGS